MSNTVPLACAPQTLGWPGVPCGFLSMPWFHVFVCCILKTDFLISETVTGLVLEYHGTRVTCHGPCYGPTIITSISYPYVGHKFTLPHNGYQIVTGFLSTPGSRVLSGLQSRFDEPVHARCMLGQQSACYVFSVWMATLGADSSLHRRCRHV